MSIKTVMNVCGVLVLTCSVAFATCGEHAKIDSNGNCQCEPGFVLNSDSGQCHHIQSSEVNVLP